MSPIIDLQRGISEAGRIRIGQQVAIGNGRTRPAKLDTFRLTSADRRRIDQAAELYGGTASEWQAPAGKQWEVITTTDSLDVIVPPSDLSFSQHYELWSAGGCQRRCDGVTEQIGEQPCVCDPAARECDIHTRLSVMLRDLPGLGVWRIDTQGWYAAREMSGAVRIIQMAAGRGALLPARLRLEQRSVKRPDDKGKVQTLRFAVPVLDIEITPAQLLAGGSEPLQLEQVTRSPLTPVPQLVGPQQSIAEQSAPPAARPTRKNAAPEIPASGRQRAATPAPASAAGAPAALPDGSPLPVAQARPAAVVSALPVDRPPATDVLLDEPLPDAELTRWLAGTHAAMRARIPAADDEHDALRTLAIHAADMEIGASLNDLSARQWHRLAIALRDLPLIEQPQQRTEDQEVRGAESTPLAAAVQSASEASVVPPAEDLPAPATPLNDEILRARYAWGEQAGFDDEALDAAAIAAIGVSPLEADEPSWQAFALTVQAGAIAPADPLPPKPGTVAYKALSDGMQRAQARRYWHEQA